VGFKFSRVDLDVILLGRAAPGIDLYDTGHGKKPPLQYPVLDGAQVAQPEVRWPDHLIAVDLADQAGRLDLGRDVAGETDVLLEIDGCLREREIVIDVVLEHDADKGQAIERGRANDIDAGRRGKADLDRNGEVALHLLRRKAWRLRRDFQNHRRWIGVGLDVEPRKSERARANKQQQAQQDQRPPGQSECEK